MDTYEIHSEDDIVLTRQAARKYADELHFSVLDKTRVATSVSELARNTLVHGGGYMEMQRAENGSTIGIRCIFVDEGPGIPDIERAIEDGFTTDNSLGQGLPCTKRLMDDFKITSTVGERTRVEIVKWK